MWGIVANLGMGIFKKLNFKVIAALAVVGIIGYFGYKYSDNLEELMQAKTDKANLEYSLNEKLETINQKNKLITNLKEDVITLQKIQKEKEEKIKKINNENTQFKQKLSTIEDSCLDRDMPPELIGLLKPEED